MLCDDPTNSSVILNDTKQVTVTFHSDNISDDTKARSGIATGFKLQYRGKTNKRPKVKDSVLYRIELPLKRATQLLYSREAYEYSIRSMSCFMSNIAIIGLQKKDGRRPNPNDSRSVALSVGPDVVNDSRSNPPPPPYPRTL